MPMARRTWTPHCTAKGSPATTSTGRYQVGLAITCPRKRHGNSPRPWWTRIISLAVRRRASPVGRDKRSTASQGPDSPGRSLAEPLVLGGSAMQRRDLLNSGLFLTGAAAVGSFAMMAAFAPSGHAAPAFMELNSWFNTKAPITIDALRGKVVLVNFWTYSCINSRRPMVYLKRWQTEYGPHGFEIIGIHTPEFRFEH